MFFKLGEYTLATFFGVLISLIVSHFLSKDRDRETHKAIAFHEAATKFRHSFDDVLLNIEEGQHSTHELLRNFFLPHKVSYWHFKYFFNPDSKDMKKGTMKKGTDLFSLKKGTDLFSSGLVSSRLVWPLLTPARSHSVLP